MSSHNTISIYLKSNILLLSQNVSLICITIIRQNKSTFWNNNEEQSKRMDDKGVL